MERDFFHSLKFYDYCGEPIMTQKEYFKTKGNKCQYQFDKLLSDIDISGLTFLSKKYDKDLVDFRSSHNLNDQEHAQTYKEMQQRKKMISDELENRLRQMEDEKYNSKDIYFNDNYDVVVKDSKGKKIFRPSQYPDGFIEIIELDSENE